MVVRPVTPVAPPPAGLVSPAHEAQDTNPLAGVADAYVAPKSSRFDKDYWFALAGCARRAPAVATAAEPLRAPDAAWAARMAIVREARDTLVCASYFVQPDAHGLEFMEALVDAAKRGVRVGLVLDTLAMPYCNKFSTPEQIERLEQLLRRLTHYGGFVSYYGGLKAQLRLPGSGMHFKAIVADGQVAMTGGRNIGGHYYGEVFNDFEMRLEGPVAKALAEDCLKMLARGDPARGARGRAEKLVNTAYRAFLDDLAARIARTPFPHKACAGLYHVVTWDVLHDRTDKDDPNRCALALVETIKRAEREVTLTSNYATGNKRLRDAVIAAAARGVKVRIMTTGESASHYSKAAFHMSQPAYAELSRHGIEIYETQHTPDHAKLYVIDDVAAFGTYNFADYGDTRLADALVFTAEPRDVVLIRSLLDASIRGCTKVEPDAALERPALHRLASTIAKLAWRVRR